MENIKKKKLIDIAPIEVTLPSKGLVYPEDNPFASGIVPLKFASVKTRDILLNQSFINKGIAIDEFIKAIMVDEKQKQYYNTLLSSDRDFLTIMSRIMVLKENYEVKITCPVCNEQTLHHFDLRKLKVKDIDYSILNRENIYTYIVKGENGLPDIEYTFKFLTVKDLREIERIRKNQQKISEYTNEQSNMIITSRLIKQILSIRNINQDILFDKPLEIREALVSELPAYYVTPLLKYIKTIEPGIDLTVEFSCNYCGHTEDIQLPIDFQRLFFPEG